MSQIHPKYPDVDHEYMTIVGSQNSIFFTGTPLTCVARPTLRDRCVSITLDDRFYLHMTNVSNLNIIARSAHVHHSL